MELTITQEDKAALTARKIFTNKVTDDFWHFSVEGLRFNTKIKKHQCIFEIHSEEGSFNCFLDLHDKRQVLKKSFTLETI